MTNYLSDLIWIVSAIRLVEIMLFADDTICARKSWKCTIIPITRYLENLLDNPDRNNPSRYLSECLPVYSYTNIRMTENI
jgi:hypothetical protein